MSPDALPRRRVVTILAAVAGASLLPGERKPSDRLLRWNGSSLGAPAHLLLHHPDRRRVEHAVRLCAAEIARLETIFALYRDDSEIARLNRDGCLPAPSHDLLLVLSACDRLFSLSGGAFDVTVQPLWEMYARHFFSPDQPVEGPGTSEITAALSRIGWDMVEFNSRQVVLQHPGMGITLNGIAQGYVTDRITGILRDNGFDRVLSDFGHSEIYAIGQHSDERPWQIGITDPRHPERTAGFLDLSSGSMCTSGGYGMRFEATGRYHHLFDPATGGSAGHYIATSVFAESAMVADALSTALYVAPPQRTRELLACYPSVTALVTLPDGAILHLPA